MAFTKFDPPASHIPADVRPPGSTNAALHELPVRRENVYDLHDKVVLLPRTGIVGIPIEMRSGGAHFRVTQDFDGQYPYPRGCDLWVSDWELQRAVQVEYCPPGWVTRTEYGLKLAGLHVAEPLAGGEPRWFATEQDAHDELAALPDRYSPTLFRREVRCSTVTVIA